MDPVRELPQVIESTDQSFLELRQLRPDVVVPGVLGRQA